MKVNYIFESEIPVDADQVSRMVTWGFWSQLELSVPEGQTLVSNCAEECSGTQCDWDVVTILTCLIDFIL